MALADRTVWEVRPTNGADTNGGGFVPGLASPGTDYSQQNAAQYALTGVTSAGAGAVMLTASAAADMKDNIVNVISGTNFTAGSYQILSVVVGVSITVDRNCTTGAGSIGVVNIGGAKQTIGAMHTIQTATNQNAAGQTVWVKAEATITVGAGITYAPSGGISTYISQLNGYTTTRGDGGKVTIQATAGSAYQMFIPNGNGLLVRNFIFDGNSRTTITGVQSGIGNGGLQMEDCQAINCTSIGFNIQGKYCTLVRCKATACATGFTTNSGNGSNAFIDCIAYANTTIGFSAAVGFFLHCIAANNTGGTTDGFGTAIAGNSGFAAFIGCVAYGNGRDGFRIGSSITTALLLQNCIGYSNTGKDIQAVTNTPPVYSYTIEYSAFGTTALLTLGTGCQTLTGSPFTNGGSNDFSLNTTAGAGALCRALGFPGVLPAGGTGYQDMGALQHQDTPSSTLLIAQNITRYVVEEGGY